MSPAILLRLCVPTGVLVIGLSSGFFVVTELGSTGVELWT